MHNYQLAFGTEKILLRFPEEFHVDLIEPAYISPAVDPLEVVRHAIQNPVDGRFIGDYRPCKSVVIAINDKTRPVPNLELLPPLLEELHSIGILRTSIKFLIATGTHTPMQSAEYSRILTQDIYQNYEVISHDCDDESGLIFCGTTLHGTPVWVNRIFKEADLRILVGNIEPHHFAGFSGGYKTAAIGLTGRQTINKNHSMLIEPGAKIAEFDNNPLRQDIEEIGKIIGGKVVALNAILNGDKKIVRAVFGEPSVVMNKGIPFCEQFCQVRTNEKFDLVIASVGGAPKDINFYQSQKALTHASLFTRTGGVIILVAACPEGTGSEAYEDFMQGIESPEDVFIKFQSQGFRVGPHKAFQVARDASRVNIVLLSLLPKDLVKSLLMKPAVNLSEATAIAFDLLAPTLPQDLRIAILPRATNTIPIVENLGENHRRNQ